MSTTTISRAVGYSKQRVLLALHPDSARHRYSGRRVAMSCVSGT